MDKEFLVKRLNEMFCTERPDGLIVDQFGLAPAYRGWGAKSFTLGVSAPSLINVNNSLKGGVIIDALFKHFTIEERMFIDRVRVFDDVKKLKEASFRDFEEYGYNDYDNDLINDLYDVIEDSALVNKPD